MLNQRNLIAVKSYEIPEKFKMDLLSNGIVEINFDPDYFHIEIGDLIDIEEGMRFLGDGKKLPFFFKAKDFMSISREAINYSKSAESGKYTLVNAVLVDNQAKKLMYNFFFRIRPPHIRTKAFKTKEDAFEWLESCLKP